MNDKKKDEHGHWIGENDSEKCTHVLDAGGDDYENDIDTDNSTTEKENIDDDYESDINTNYAPSMYSVFDEEIGRINKNTTVDDLAKTIHDKLNGEKDIEEIKKYIKDKYEMGENDSKLLDKERYNFGKVVEDIEFANHPEKYEYIPEPIGATSEPDSPRFTRKQVNYLYVLNKQGKINLPQNVISSLYDIVNERESGYYNPHDNYARQRYLVKELLNRVSKNELEKAQNLIEYYTGNYKNILKEKYIKDYEL